jgi:agmatinase
MNALDTKIDHLLPDTIAVLGIPLDENSSFLRGPALAPTCIRESFYSASSNLWTENQTDLGADQSWQFVGNLDFSGDEPVFAQIENSIVELLSRKVRVISLGGDHSIAYPILRAYAKGYPELNVLQLDAHPDLYDELDGNRQSHACPFARVMEEKLVKRLVQVGIRTINVHQREQAESFGVEIYEMRDEFQLGALEFEGPVYLSLDLDCLDPAFAPGVSHHEPGGLSTREVLNIIQNFNGKLVGADIVEYNPERDSLGITGMVAAKLLKEILDRMLVEL